MVCLCIPEWSRECNSGGSGRHHRGNISDVGVLGLISLLSLAFASMFTVLALSLAIVTLLLLVLLLLLVRPLLVVPVRVTTLALHCADFIGIMLIRAMADRVCLELSDNGITHFT